MLMTLGRGLAPVSNLSSAPSLKCVVPSCVFDLDATRNASFAGTGQIWRNLVSAPADGAGQQAYDFYLGSTASPSTDDPTFVGAPGSPTAYFALDGGDFFRVAANTPFLDDLQKTGTQTPWTVIVIYKVVTGGTQTYFASRTSTSSRGVAFTQTGGGSLILGVTGDSANVTQTGSSTSWPSGQWMFCAHALNATRTQFRHWINSRTKNEMAFTPNDCALVASGRATIGGSAGSGGHLLNGTRLVACSMFNTYLDDSDIAKAIGVYNARHLRTYA